MGRLKWREPKSKPSKGSHGDISPEVRKRLQILRAWRDNGFITDVEYEREIEKLFGKPNFRQIFNNFEKSK